MTFSEGMQIDTSTTSTSGGGRGARPRSRDRRRHRRHNRPVDRAVSRHRSRHGTFATQQQINTQDVEAPGFDLSQCKTGEDANQYPASAGWSPRATPSTPRGRAAAARATTRPRRTGCSAGSVDTGCGPATTDVGPVLLPGRPDRLLRPRLLRRAASTSSAPAAARWRRRTSWPTSTATTCRTCRACSAEPSRAPQGPRAPGARRVAGRLLRGRLGRTTPRSPSRRVPACRSWSR